MKKLLGVAALVVLTAVALSTPTSAFHGAFWKSTSAKAKIAGVEFPATVDWTGRQVGNQGTVTVKIMLPNTAIPIHSNTFQVRENWGAVFFVGCVEFAQPYSHAGVAANTWVLNGVMRNDLCTGNNNNDFTSTYLGNIAMTIKSNGGFGIAHG